MMTRDDHVIKKIMQVCDSWMHAGDAKMTALHDAAVKQGAMQQLLVWIGFFELFGFCSVQRKTLKPLGRRCTGTLRIARG